ncbi:MAG: gamma carbonic anhydrase family protein [Ignavibacteriae bacterium]|jgi:carbonic anhydrase/acetyltransferase-like protein (isoleucine patch superfamily)|nr:gamma carbonic anhydrase family protein [Ignavibacteriota bacterium]
MIIPYNGITPVIHESVFICEGAQIIGDVVLEKDVSVWFNAVVRGDVNYVRVGERTNIQDGSILHNTYQKYPLTIGKDVTIGHGVILHGCNVRDRVLIGMGAVLLDDCDVGSGSFIAAGALVREHFKVPEGVLVAGVPGKIIRDLKPEEIAKIDYGVKNYLMYVENYRKGK